MKYTCLDCTHCKIKLKLSKSKKENCFNCGGVLPIENRLKILHEKKSVFCAKGLWFDSKGEKVFKGIPNMNSPTIQQAKNCEKFYLNPNDKLTFKKVEKSE